MTEDDVLDPETLYTVESEPRENGSGVLLHALQGFVDAGSATRLAADHLLETLEHRRVATFDADQLIDYRARRPAMVYDRDHYTSYREPRLELHAVTDAGGQEFLLLTGPEPDVQWERFVAAVRQLVERFEVRTTVALHAIPMAVPHTLAETPYPDAAAVLLARVSGTTGLNLPTGALLAAAAETREAIGEQVR